MKHYTINGITYDKLPDPLHLKGGEVSPMSEELFVRLGGTIEDDGESTPQEKFLSGLDAYLDELEAEAREHYAIIITKEEFKQAAATMLSSDLIAWAKGKGVPDEMIESVRKDILTKKADGERLGLTWYDIFPKNN